MRYGHLLLAAAEIIKDYAIARTNVIPRWLHHSCGAMDICPLSHRDQAPTNGSSIIVWILGQWSCPTSGTRHSAGFAGRSPISSSATNFSVTCSQGRCVAFLHGMDSDRNPPLPRRPPGRVAISRSDISVGIARLMLRLKRRPRACRGGWRPVRRPVRAGPCSSRTEGATRLPQPSCSSAGAGGRLLSMKSRICLVVNWNRLKRMRPRSKCTITQRRENNRPSRHGDRASHWVGWRRCFQRAWS